MRKLLIFGVLFFGRVLQALATSNPETPSMIQEGFFFSSSCPVSLRAGYEGSFVFDRRMKQENPAGGRIDNLKMDSHLGLAIVNLWKRWDLFGGAGQARLRSDWRFEAPDANIYRIDLETHYGFTWTIGTDFICYQWKGAIISLGGRYEQSKPSLLWITRDGQPFTVDKGSEMDWKEWQANASISYKIDFLIPYIGVKYSKVRGTVTTIQGELIVPIASDGGESLKMESRKNWGMVLGCGLSNSKYFQLNVEARLFDEEAGTVYGDFRF
jgi:hypothetical protein